MAGLLRAGAGSVLLLACLIFSPGCGCEEPAGRPPERLSIAFQSWVGYGPLLQYRKQVAGLYWPTYQEALDHFGSEQGPGWLYELFDTIALIKRANGRIPRKPEAAPALRPEILRTLYDGRGAGR